MNSSNDYISHTNLEVIRERMGADTTATEAARMVELLTERGFVNTSDVPDDVWFGLIPNCIGC